jgi:hypothetical protein
MERTQAKHVLNDVLWKISGLTREDVNEPGEIA